MKYTFDIEFVLLCVGFGILLNSCYIALV